MELYILDDQFRRIEVVDIFESLIWTERYSDIGDFELVIRATFDTVRQFQVDNWIASNVSYRAMRVETVSNKVESDGVHNLHVTGRSIEYVLDNRVAMPEFKMTNQDTGRPQWVLTGTPLAIGNTIFQTICVQGKLNAGDKIPFYTAGDIFLPGGIPFPTTSTTIGFDPATVYEDLKSLCETYKMGFRLVRNFDTSQIYFAIYMGTDRTSKQTDVPPVVFGTGFNNFSEPEELTSSAAFKNVAYVFADKGTAVAYAQGTPSSVSGFDRRILLVKPNTSNDVPANQLTTVLQQSGYLEMGKVPRVYAMDGTVSKNSEYKYGVNYGLGDIVEVHNDYGVISYMLVKEQIFISDREGERSYPALQVESTENLAVDWPEIDSYWDDVDSSITWDNIVS